MPSAIPKRDPSAGRLVCRRPGCGVSHVPEVDCPPKGRWLVEYFQGVRSPAAVHRRPRG